MAHRGHVLERNLHGAIAPHGGDRAGQRRRRRGPQQAVDDFGGALDRQRGGAGHSGRGVPGTSNPVQRIEAGLGQPQRRLRLLIGRADLGREGLAFAAVTQPGEHVHRRDPVGDAVMDFHQDRPPPAREALDDPALPEGAIAIEPRLHCIGDEPEQRLVVTGVRKCYAVNVMSEIDVRIVHPLRRAEVQRMHAQHLSEPWDRQYSLGDAGNE